MFKMLNFFRDEKQLFPVNPNYFVYMVPKIKEAVCISSARATSGCIILFHNSHPPYSLLSGSTAVCIGKGTSTEQVSPLLA